VNEAAVAFVGALDRGGGGPRDGAKQFALLGGFAARLSAFIGFAIKRLGDGGGGALLTKRKNFDVELARFILNVEQIADANFARRLSGLAITEHALQLTCLGGLLAGLEEAGGPEPFVNAGSSHASIFADLRYAVRFRLSPVPRLLEACDPGERKARR